MCKKCSLERFHSRDYWSYWFTETKESICIKIEFNTQRFSLDTNMAAISLFWDTNMAVVTSCENTLLRNVSFLLLEILKRRTVAQTWYYAVGICQSSCQEMMQYGPSLPNISGKFVFLLRRGYT